MQGLRERLEKEFMKPESKELDKMVRLLTLTDKELEEECVTQAQKENVFQIEENPKEEDDLTVVSEPDFSSSDEEPQGNRRLRHHIRMDGVGPSNPFRNIRPKIVLGLPMVPVLGPTYEYTPKYKEGKSGNSSKIRKESSTGLMKSIMKGYEISKIRSTRS